ncbi:hypothetical protein PGIGA_G00002920 [Pangasianodon gigas]|uniref:Uncharacterized protein n=1 Tax=Pangasianodon gigas TaxID=30993 RepID=A0ACC5W548_PANGG|nr:hypothetical protein [Pangasianodon gigas]
MSNCSQSLTVFQLCSAVAMEIACKERARAVGAERQRDENTVNEQNECTVTWSVPKLEASSEEEVVSGGFSDDVCCVCGGNVAFLDHQTEHFIKHTDEVCCHLCQMKFSHMNTLALHLKNAHPKYHVFCKSCNMYMGRHPLKEWTVETDKTPETPKQKLLDEEILPSSQGPLKIVAMFVNQSKELALQKRMRQSWRSKAVFPCRQCGAVSRQFSLGVRHRYQHRGPRLHRCQCGRAFQQRMHLLRHQVQHAEATRYVCAACGQMFCGTQQLACHRPLFRITPSNRKKQANKECRNMFQCYCGYSFTRPAALLWHMLKNSKARKPRLKGFRLT